MDLLGQTSGWTQTYLGATDIDVEGTWTWIKTGGTTFWEGGDPASGGAAVSGMYANFLSGEPNNGAGGNSQNCLVIGVGNSSPLLIHHQNTHIKSIRKVTVNGETSCARRQASSCARRQQQKEEHLSPQRPPLLAPQSVRFLLTSFFFLSKTHP